MDGASPSLPSSWFQKVSMLRIAAESQERSTTGARLLENADKTGDIILLCKNGVEMAAHSAVLAESPYFWARFSKDWQSSQWNFNNKLKLRLPFDVTTEALEILIEYLYIGSSCFAPRGPLNSLLLQELLSLAEACAIPNLCKVLVSLVEVDEENVKMWLCWLEQERTGDVKLILSQCSEVLQKKFQRLSQWALLSPEELSQLCKIGEHLHSASLKPYTNLNEGQVSVKLITEWDIKQRIGKSGIFDLVNFDKIEGCRMDGGTSFANFKDLQEFPFVLHERTSNDILLFFKMFDVEKETLKYIGSMYVDSTSTVAAYIQRFRGLARMNEEHDCKVFEEIKFLPNTMVVELHQGLTFKALQLEHGDIICIQKWMKRSDKGSGFDPTAFLEDLKSRLLGEAF